MARTPEQKAADEQLGAAIEAALAAHGLKTGVTSDYIVVAAQQHFGDDGVQRTNIARLVPGDGVPHYRLMGLLDYALTHYRTDICFADEDEED